MTNNTKMVRDALGDPIPQILNDNGTYSVLANGDTTGIDFRKYKLLRDPFGSVLPYQYFDVEQMKFVAGALGGEGGGSVTSVNGKMGIVNLTANDIGAVRKNDFDDYVSRDTLNRYCSDNDGNDIYRIVEFKRSDDTLYMISILSESDGKGNYLKCTWNYYDKTGVNIINTVVWALTYDGNDNIISKVVL